MQKSVIITGATRGIGRACALKFAQMGWCVTGSYAKSQQAAQQLEQEIANMGGSCQCIPADLRDSDAVQRMVKLAQMAYGTPDAVVCNAGIAQQKLFSDITERDWDDMFDVNTKGVYRVVHAALPMLLSQQKGSIVTVSSIWGQTGGSCEVHYSASKAAVIGMTKALAKELGLSGIRVNCVAPGYRYEPHARRSSDAGACRGNSARKKWRAGRCCRSNLLAGIGTVTIRDGTSTGSQRRILYLSKQKNAEKPLPSQRFLHINLD